MTAAVGVLATRWMKLGRAASLACMSRGCIQPGMQEDLQQWAEAV